jgi:hypothetical protein
MNRIDKILDEYKRLKPIRLNEIYNKEKLKWCFDNFEHITSILQGDIQFIKTQQEGIFKILNRESNHICYIPKTRFVPDSSCFIGIKKEIRTYCTNEYYLDIDGCESHYRIMLWTAKCLDIPIDHYRELKNILSKKECYIMMNGGDDYGFTEGSMEIEQVYKVLKGIYPCFIVEDSDNPQGQFLSRYLNAIEMVLVNRALRYFQNKRFQVGGIFYDGFFVERTNELDRVYDSILEDISIELFQDFGIRYEFKIKEHDDIIAKTVYDKIIYREPVIRDNRYVDAVDLNYPSKVVLVQAGLALGKSTAVQSFLSQNGHQYDRIVVLCPRRTYSKSILKDFRQYKTDFFYYLDNNRSRDIRRAYIIIQFESLWRLNTSFYTSGKLLVIADEIEATCTQITSFETNKGNHLKNIQTFESLLKGSQKIIGLDAFIEFSQKSIHLMRDLQLEYHYFLYNYQYVNRKYVRVSGIKVFTECLKNRLQAGEKVFCYVSSKYRVEVIVKELGLYFGNQKKIASYVSNSHSTKLENVEVEWRGYDLVICNSTITIGLDFNPPSTGEPYFDYIFLYISQKSRNLMRDALQASYRPRQVRKGAIICIDTNERDIKHSGYRCDLDFTQKQVEYRIKEYNRVIREGDLNSLTIRDKPWVKNMFIRNAYEHINDVYNLKDRMIDLLKYCGYHEMAPSSYPDFFFVKDIEVKLEEERWMLENGLMFDEINIEDEIEIEIEIELEIEDEKPGPVLISFKEYKDFPFIDIPTLTKEDYLSLCRNNQRTTLDELALEKYRWINRYTLDRHGEYFQFYLDYKKCFFKLRQEYQLTHNRISLLSYLNKTTPELRQKYWLQAFRNQEVFNLLGLQNSFSKYNVDISPKQLEIVFKKYKKSKDYLEMCDLLDLPVNKHHGLKDVHMCITMLNHILKQYTCGKIEKKEHRIQSNGKRVKEYSYKYVQDPKKDFDIELMTLKNVK